LKSAAYFGEKELLAFFDLIEKASRQLNREIKWETMPQRGSDVSWNWVTQLN
jgi:hypothetical protein